VAKGVTLHPVRVFGCANSTSTSIVIAGVERVTANRALPAVANMSLGGLPSDALDLVVRVSIASGVTHVVAAGNDQGLSACQKSPARVAEAVTVAASDVNDQRPGFSNTGVCVDLFAPGVGVLSAWHTSDTAQALASGTSMASPHVAGAAARFVQTSPATTPAAVQQTLIDNATFGRLTNIGAGSPNRLLYTGFLDTQFIASYVPYVDAPRETFASTSANPPAFDFFYDQSLGHFEERPGGVCNAGQNNPTYLMVRFVLPPGQQAQACSFRASWDSQWINCNANHLNLVNSGTWVILNTDRFGRVPTPPCPLEQPLRSILPFNQLGWFHVNLTVNGDARSRRVNFIKTLDIGPPPPPPVP
jgi:hypothetical protein